MALSYLANCPTFPGRGRRLEPAEGLFCWQIHPKESIYAKSNICYPLFHRSNLTYTFWRSPQLATFDEHGSVDTAFVRQFQKSCKRYCNQQLVGV